MKHSYITGILLTFLLALALATGCDKSSVPPTPIALEELSPALEKAFAKATPEIKDVASRVCVSLQAQDYAKAYLDLQALAGMSGLNKEQGSILARGMLCMNTTLQSAQAKGDQKAAAALQLHQMTK